MDFFCVCMLICVGIQVTTTQPLPFSVENSAVREECSAATPKMIQLIGRSISLECSIQNWEKQPISWSKILPGDGASYLEISNGKERRIQDDRYILVEDPGHLTFTLQIQNLKETDSGLYQCTNNGNQQFTRVEVEILRHY